MRTAALVRHDTIVLLRVEGEPDRPMTLAQLARELGGTIGFYLPDVVKALSRGDVWLGDAWSVEVAP